MTFYQNHQKLRSLLVDNNSPDCPRTLVETHKQSQTISNNTINILHRKAKNELGSVVLHGIQNTVRDLIVVTDSNLSHSPAIMLKLINTLKKLQYDVVITSRYVPNTSILN